MLKYRIRVGFSLDKVLVDKLKELSDSTRIPASKLLDEAIADLLKKFEGKGQN